VKAIRVGSRGSKLALAQAEGIIAALRQQGWEAELRVVRTEGDARPDQPLASAANPGLFVKELEEALLRGEIDLAVHSMKDMPASLPDGLVLAPSPRREDPRDVLVLPRGQAGNLAGLAPAALIGTGSVRRQGYLLAERSDLQFNPIRGNIDTRLAKLDRGEVRAIVLAAAGLNRLGLSGRISALPDPDLFVPQAGQGTLGLELRAGEAALAAALAPLGDAATTAEARAERAFLQTMNMGCQAPLGCLGRASGDLLTLSARLCDRGRKIDRFCTLFGPLAKAEELGRDLGRRMLALSGGS
jgi:hydroxymethylbilane synthase